MYNIEQFLIQQGLKLKQSYASGVLVYQQCDEDGFFGDEVALFCKHDPKCWEINIRYPYHIFIDGIRGPAPNLIEDCKSILEEHLKRNIDFNAALAALPNPWQEI